MDVINSFAQLLRPYLSEIAISLVACTLVIAGNDINRFVRGVLRGHNFVLRTLAFVLINAFGYGLLIVHLSPFLARQLATLNSNWLVCVVCGSFLVIGVWAQRNRQV
jgi:hypothetical protein